MSAAPPRSNRKANLKWKANVMRARAGLSSKMAVPKKNDEPVHWFDKEHEIYADWARQGLLHVFS